jgi:dihydrofolate synthase/folylpolyglutamate synthase
MPLNVGSMNINKAIDWLYNVRRFGPDRTLEPTRKYLELLGCPQNSFQTIHIGGTNGKGSTSAFIASILRAAGYKVGLYTSPHLERFNERIKVNSDEISNSDIARLLTNARQIFEEMIEYPEPMPLRFFDIITGVCFKYFEEKEVDIGVIEVGLGGRLDATNLIKPLVSVITNIGYEHVNILGPTLEDIAYEKAGIIKEKTPIVTGEDKPNVLEVFKITADELGSELIQVKECLKYKRISSNSDGQIFYLKTTKTEYNLLKIPLHGIHQILNAVTAVATVETLVKNDIIVPSDSIIKGVQNVYWPARLEVIHHKPMIVIDCAKDAEATQVIKETIQNDLTNCRIIAVVSISSDKNIEGMIEHIASIADSFILTKHSVTHRAAEPKRLIKEIIKYNKPYTVYLDREKAFRYAVDYAGTNDMVLVIGSVYLAGNARSFYSRFFSS